MGTIEFRGACLLQFHGTQDQLIILIGCKFSIFAFPGAESENADVFEWAEEAK